MLIIDGHNLIGACYDIKLSDKNAKDKLITKLKEFQHINNNKIILVFDGKGFGEFEVSHEDKIEIRYPTKNQTADDVIKNLIKKHVGDQSVKIVSSDNQIIKEAKYHKLTSIKSQDFLLEFNKRIIKSNQPQIDVDDWLNYYDNMK